MSLINELRKAKKRIRRYYYLNINKSSNKKNFYKWFDDKGDEKLRLDYPLDDNSIVLDVGGYVGDFASDIYCRYSSNIYSFEPLKPYYEKIVERFKCTNKVKAFQEGLSSENSSAFITVKGSASSTENDNSDNKNEIRLRSIMDFLQEYPLEEIDLMKINIEGGEYALLDAMIKNDLLKKVKYFQIQFHDFVEGAGPLREKIRTALAETHNEQWCYPFVWESWQRK